MIVDNNARCLPDLDEQVISWMSIRKHPLSIATFLSDTLNFAGCPGVDR
jgi:hypothetical protein